MIINVVGQGGASGGQCAGGFGVCRYFLAECGRTYSQNLTYWTKTSGTATSPCTINVCKCQAEVCFLRLDFNSFNLYQPDTDTTAANPTLAGQCVQVRAGEVVFAECSLLRCRYSASKSSIRRFVITEKAPTRAFSWLKATTTAFTFKTLLRHYAQRALTPQSLNMKLGLRRNYHT